MHSEYEPHDLNSWYLSPGCNLPFRLAPLMVATGVAMSGWPGQGHAALAPGDAVKFALQPHAPGYSSHARYRFVRTGPFGRWRGTRGEPLAAQRTEIVFMDSRVPALGALTHALRPGRKVVFLQPGGDGLRQIANVLREYPHVDAIHIVSHGERGALLLGDSTLDLDNLDDHRKALAVIRRALRGGGDLMLYGCDVAAGSEGAAFIAALAQVTGADVAASTDATGATARNGDWNLEIASGDIETAVPFRTQELDDWDYVLYTGTVTSEAQLSSALASAAGDASDDVITISGTLSLSGTVDLSGWNSGTSGNLTLQGDGGGNDILDGGYGGFRVLDIGANADVTLDSLVIQKGLLAGAGGNVTDYAVANGQGGNGGDALGAGIRNAGTLNIVSSTVSHNFASGGGGGSPYSGTGYRVYSAGGGGGAGLSGGSGADGGQWPNYAYGGGSIHYTTASGSTGGSGAANHAGYTGTGGNTHGGSPFDNSAGPYGVGGTGGTAYDSSTAEIGGGGGGGAGVGFAGRGGNAVGGIYNTGTLTIQSGTITGNFGAGGGGATTIGGSSTPGDGGFGVGGIYNNGGTLRWDSTTNGNFSHNGGGGGGGATPGTLTPQPPTGSNGASATNYFNDGNSDGSSDTTNLNTNYSVYDSDGTVTAGAGVTEPVAMPTTATSTGSAVNIYDFTISDGGGGDGAALTVSQIKVHTGGTVDPTKLTYRLNGPDVSNVTGSYSGGVATFSGLSISVADGASETYTLNVYYNDNTGLTENQTLTLSTDGDTDFTVGSGGTAIGATLPVTNSTGSTVDVTATKLAFTTEPAGSVSGSALITQPVVKSEDAAGNTDVDFTGNVALTEASAGTLSGTTTVAASSGVATFTNVAYTATADQQSFTLSASTSGLTNGTASSVTSDVVATQLVFAAQPSPTTLQSGASTAFTTVPAVATVDNDNTVDTGYSTDIVLSVTDPNDSVVDGTVNSLSGTGDTDGSATTVTLTPSSGAATFSGLAIQYTNGGTSDTIALRASSGGLTAANSSDIMSNALPVVTDGNITISGGSGTGGAYKIGDVVTATWNNTGGGDNNSGITGVSVDFSQFGGGSAVAASNSSGTWTATYTITAGAIDSTNLNVSVSATNAGGTTTTADTTNATVDDVAPAVSDANISISGATGSGGAYKVGDTVTATWNDTAGGDNNSDTISGVTVDFSAFGGGSAVSASNSSGTWTATYTLVAGVISGSNKNISLSVTDNAGNVITRADSSNATVDTTVPSAPTMPDLAAASDTGASNTDNNTSDTTPALTGTADANVTVTVTSSIDGILGTVSADGSGNWSFTPSTAVSEGTHSLTAAASDAAGNVSAASAALSVTVDTTKPSIPTVDLNASSDTGSSSTDNITSDNAPTFAGTADSNTSITLRDQGGNIGQATADGSGNWTATVGSFGNLSEGVRQVTAYSSDLAGNMTASATLNVTVDTTPPAAPSAPDLATGSDSGASNTDNITADTTPTLTGNAEANATVTISSNVSGTLGSASADGSGNWSFTPGALSAGTHSLTVTATDAAGNASPSSAALGITVDTAAPAAPSTPDLAAGSDTGTSNTDNITSDTTPTLTGSAEADATVTVTSSLDGTLGTVNADGSGNWSFTAGAALSAGTHSFSATATDAAGNVSAASGALSVTIDNSAPNIPSTPDLAAGSDTGTSNTDNITSDTTPTLTGSAEADATVTVSSNVTGTLGTASADGSGNWSFTPGSALSAGSYAFTVKATDTSGQVSATSSALVVTIDTTAPATPAAPDLTPSSDTGISDTDNITSDTTPTLTGSAEADATVTVSSNVTGTLGSATADGSGNWSFTAGSALSAGTHAITITATDAAGNASVSSAALSVTIDTSSPAVTSVTLPADGVYIAGQHLDFTVNYDQNVIVDTGGGTPRLALTVGSSTLYATYQSGSGGKALVFRYTVSKGDDDYDGITLDATLQLNGGSLRNAAGNSVAANLGSFASLASVLVSTTDSDADGISDYQEGLDGTNPNDPNDYVDVTPPVVSAPADIVLDADGLHTGVSVRQLLGLAPDAGDALVQQTLASLASDNADGVNCCNTTPLKVNDGVVYLPPGNNQITWRAIDRKGNSAEATQVVKLRPRVSLDKDQVAVEGGSVKFRVLLNGPSTYYPFTVPYVIDPAGSADSSDHDLANTGQVTFTAGQTGADVTVNVAADSVPEGDETLILDLDDRTSRAQDLSSGYSESSPDIYDINSGAKTQHTITITEGNVAPSVALDLLQGSIDHSIYVTPGGGPVTVTATVTDPNSADTHRYDWSGSDTQLMDSDGNLSDASFVFYPSLLSPGLYTMRVTATDSHQAADSTRLYFRVMAQLPTLSAAVDSDGDGIDDKAEGSADSDGDGIPDYLDNIAASNVLPETAAVTGDYLLECDAGVRCRLGRYSLQSSGGGAKIDSAEVDEDTGYSNSGGLFDFQIDELPRAGQTVRIVVPQTAAIPADAVYRKFANGVWSDFVVDADNAVASAPGVPGYCPPPGDAGWRAGLNAGDYCVELTMADGGANDADGLANNSVVDPGGVAIATGVSVDVHSTGSGSGQLRWPALLALSLLVLVRNRRGKRRVAMLVAALLALLSAEGHAAQSGGWQQRVLDNGYVELGLYQARGTQTGGDFINGLKAEGVDATLRNYDVTRAAYQVSVGYRYHPLLAVEFGYLDLGDVDVDMTATAADNATLSRAMSDNYPISGSGWTLSNRFVYPIQQKLAVSAEVGLYRWDGKIGHNSGAINLDIKGGTDPLLGVGIRYAFSSHYSAQFKLKRIFLGDQKVDLLGGTIVYALK